MKQKVVIDIPLITDGGRSKAMQIAVAIKGVTSVNIDKEKSHLVVTGEGFDSFHLMKCLKKRFKCSNIVSIEEVKPPNKDEEKKKKEAEAKKKKEEEAKKKKEEEAKCKPCCPPNPPCVQYYPCVQPVYDNYNPSCTIV
ncbi:heavy metal-associated isoprenylated plant protein 4-like isoform X1 [Lycium ferocissimum]|uniref:heavy metal-associated isoprenylated plant protein 4-like isoform X1 n=2 Tax=Lycium ferocissimum TaxID=112874 RepID=UPI0028163C03|nr:heavy metal-associated isoprenylated plant protein 4-like isoform X1 [Lycium ferocissimum]